jgi:hypothetical protein
VRERRLNHLGAVVSVDGGSDGSIAVARGGESEIRLEARLAVFAESRERARALAGQVTIVTRGLRVRTEGPAGTPRAMWTVSFRLTVPDDTSLDLVTENGSIHLSGVVGHLRLESQDGTLVLDRVGGQIRGRTTNGRVELKPAGESWSGEGVDVASTNGIVRVALPSPYSARLDLTAANGRIRVAVPGTSVDGNRRSVTLDLGQGGRTIRASTVRGAIEVVTAIPDPRSLIP